MKKVSIPLLDLLEVLEALAQGGTEDIIIFEKDGYPAICDAVEPDSYVTFAAVSEEGGEDDQLEFDSIFGDNGEGNGDLH